MNIAVVGIGCRFPGGVRSAEDFWSFLEDGRDGMVDVPADRWDIDRFYDPDPDAPGRMYVRRGGFLDEDLWSFDTEFFGISPREASIMDPQQRLMLEVAWESLDDAGLAPKVAGRDVGVYVGAFMSDSQVARHSPGARRAINSHTATSSTFTMISNRVSFALDLRGPSMSIDTACSSSLVAIHEATQAVARGECELAIAGGVNVMLQPETFVTMCKGRFLAPDGRCKSFDASADGYARGEGAGAIVLKPLDAALRDGDRIYAVIRATGSNQDGRTIGITVPNPVAQEALVRRVCAEAGLDPAAVSYVEAHGTGTSIGDPLEMAALGGALGGAPGRAHPVLVGSVKAAIGHLEAAAGVAGLIKAALTVHHRTVTPQAWLQELNPAIPFDELGLQVATARQALPGGDEAAVGVNSFGYGGTNAHAVLVPAPAPSEVAASRPQLRVFPVTGRTDEVVRAAAAALADTVDRLPDLEEVDAHTRAAWDRRVQHGTRLALPYQDRDDLVKALRAVAEGERSGGTRVVDRDGRGPVYVFSGMGPQWWRMGRDLLAIDGPFARKAAEIDAAFLPIAGWSIIEELRRDEADSRVTQTQIAQPANFLVQVALCAEFEAAGIQPSLVVGHSVGEVSAAYISGALSLHDALLVSYHRARLQATMAGSGGMLAVGMPEADVAEHLQDVSGVCIAAVNSASSVTLAGDRETLAYLRARFADLGHFARELRVEVPYHSHLMDPILDELRATLSVLRPQAPAIPLVSTVTADLVGDELWGADYWCANVREPVRFADAMARIVGEGHRAFVEVGPHPVLGGNIREVLVRAGETGAVIPTLQRDEHEPTSVIDAVSAIFVSGAVDRIGGDDGAPTPHRPLPANPWHRSRLWTEEPVTIQGRLGDADSRPMLGDRTGSVAEEWEVELSSGRFAWLGDHVVDGLVLLPGAAYVDAALSAAERRTDRDGFVLEDVRFRAPLVVDAGDVPVFRVAVEGTTNRVLLSSRPATGADWTLHASARVVDAPVRPHAIDTSIPAGARHLDVEGLYRALADRGLAYGPHFRSIRAAAVSDDRVVATVAVPRSGRADGTEHLVHPVALDGALQCVAALADGRGAAMVPYGVASVRWFRALPEEVTVVVARRAADGLHADVALVAADGTLCVELQDIEFRAVGAGYDALTELGRLWYDVVWEPVARLALDDGELDGAAELDGVGRPAGVVVAVGSFDGTRVGDLAGLLGHRLVVVDDGADATAATQAALAQLRAGDDAELRLVVVLGDDADAVGSDWVTALVDIARGHQESEKAADAAGDSRPVMVTVVTTAGQPLPDDPFPPDLAHAAVIGTTRVLRNESVSSGWRLVDAAPDTPVSAIAAAVERADIPADVLEEVDELALRGATWFVPRFRQNLEEYVSHAETPAPLVDANQPYALEIGTSGRLSDLGFRTIERRPPGRREVEVRIDTIGLNYKDPLKILGILRPDDLEGTYFGTSIGMECAGVILSVGPEVDGLTPGDRVVVGTRDMFRRFMTVSVDEAFVEPYPAAWRDEDCGSTLPFLTAHYGLVHAGRLLAGETVLVHGAAGGMGLAAIQVAKHLGATVIASAGTDERRELVRSLGASAAVSSRSVDFVDEVLALTGGRGVDVVFNSLPGEFVRQNLAVAAEMGRIVEIGKADIYQSGQLDLRPFDRNLSFVAVDIDRIFLHRRDIISQLFAEFGPMIDAGIYRPLPAISYPLAELPAALEAVVRSQHVGRVVVHLDPTFTPAPLALDVAATVATSDSTTTEAEATDATDAVDEGPLLVRPLRPGVDLRADGTYVVTGGFGGFGLATAQWLARKGAGTIALVGRSGAKDDATRDAIAEMAALGTDVVQVKADVSVVADVRALFEQLASAPPIRGIFHAAGVTDDRVFAEVDEESVLRVMYPKALGAWHLHRELEARGIEVDHFVLYSSVSSLTGTMGQTQYAAANAVLGALAHLRRRQGRAALAVDWGGIADAGMAVASEEIKQILSILGLELMPMATVIDLLEETMRLDPVRISITDVDWVRFASTHPASAPSSRFAHLIRANSDGGSGAALRDELLALPEAERAEVVAYILAEQVSTVLGLPAEAIDLDTPLPDLGLDSLMALELGARINVTLGLEVSALEFGRGGGLRGLGERLTHQLLAGAEVR